MTYNLSCRLFTDAKCFGPGVAQLLHAVQELHSLRAAALSMDMAYSKAWTIIKNSEKALGFSLLDSTTGGKGGGGAALTPEGARLLRAYDTFCSRLHDAADELFQEEFAPFL
ncbi:MAG: winged helix-turn-helix domain-containing protein [Oscillospiraceae bacterium]